MSESIGSFKLVLSQEHLAKLLQHGKEVTLFSEVMPWSSRRLRVEVHSGSVSGLYEEYMSNWEYLGDGKEPLSPRQELMAAVTELSDEKVNRILNLVKKMG